jgi:hypothetical protein
MYEERERERERERLRRTREREKEFCNTYTIVNDEKKRTRKIQIHVPRACAEQRARFCSERA